MKPEEFCDGVKILLARMETNPEDFDREQYDFSSSNPLDPKTQRPKFYWLYDMMQKLLRGEDVRTYLDWQVLHKDERDALVTGFKNMMRKRFSEDIMKTLMEDEKVTEDVSYASKKKMRLNPSQMQLMQQMNQAQQDQYLRGLGAMQNIAAAQNNIGVGMQGSGNYYTSGTNGIVGNLISNNKSGGIL